MLKQEGIIGLFIGIVVSFVFMPNEVGDLHATVCIVAGSTVGFLIGQVIGREE